MKTALCPEPKADHRPAWPGGRGELRRLADCILDLADWSARQMKELWSGRHDSNVRPPRPKRGALPLRYAPAIILYLLSLLGHTPSHLIIQRSSQLTPPNLPLI